MRISSIAIVLGTARTGIPSLASQPYFPRMRMRVRKWAGGKGRKYMHERKEGRKEGRKYLSPALLPNAHAHEENTAG